MPVRCCTGLDNAKKDSAHEPEMGEMNYPYLFQTVPDGRHGGPALWLGRLAGPGGASAGPGLAKADFR